MIFKKALRNLGMDNFIKYDHKNPTADICLKEKTLDVLP